MDETSTARPALSARMLSTLEASKRILRTLRRVNNDIYEAPPPPAAPTGGPQALGEGTIQNLNQLIDCTCLVVVEIEAEVERLASIVG